MYLTAYASHHVVIVTHLSAHPLSTCPITTFIHHAYVPSTTTPLRYMMVGRDILLFLTKLSHGEAATKDISCAFIGTWMHNVCVCVGKPIFVSK